MTTYEADIPLSLAQAAHAGTSFVPEKRATEERAEYAQTLAADYETFKQHAAKGGTLDSLDVEFARYREGFRKHYTALLSSRSRIVSTMIAGPSNFPSRRMEKRNEVERKRLEGLLEFRERAVQAVIRNLRPDLRPIMSGDSDAAERLAEKIMKAEQMQERMKAANAVIRKGKKRGRDEQVADLVAIGFSEAIAGKLLEPDFCKRIGFPSYELTNNSANIRRMKQRLARVSRNQQAETQEIEGEHARFEDSPADNRVRLYFPGKPDADVRTNLKKNGFRWSPTIGSWQAYRNTHSIKTAREVAGIDAPKKLSEPIPYAPVFLEWIASVASEHGKTPEQVLEWWKEYARDCRIMDQSPVEFEFLQWYSKKLAA